MEPGKMLTLSDLYRKDINGEVNIVLTNPTSASKNRGEKRLYFNERWRIDDEIDPLNADTCNHAIHSYIIVGDNMKIVGPRAPDYFVKHWERSLNQEVTLHYGSLNNERPHVVSFPLDTLRSDLHAVDPDVHWKLLSKEFIEDIDCPQAGVLDKKNMKYPCFVKLGRSSHGKGVWRARDEKQYHTLMDFLHTNMPTSNIIITEAIKDVVTTFICIFYISTEGGLRWLGVTESIFDVHGIFLGGTVDNQKQSDFEELLLPVINPVAAALHREGFFGIANVDIVLDNKRDLFVVDINPRVGGTTKLLLLMLHFRSQGYNHGSYYSSIKFNMRPTDVIKFAEEFTEGKIIILRAIPYNDGGTMVIDCSIVVFCQNSDAKEKVMQGINAYALEAHDDMSQKIQGGKTILI